MTKQYNERLVNLTEGAKQVFMVDMTDFNLSKDMQVKIKDKFMEGKNSENVKIELCFCYGGYVYMHNLIDADFYIHNL